MAGRTHHVGSVLLAAAGRVSRSDGKVGLRSGGGMTAILYLITPFMWCECCGYHIGRR